MSQCVELGDMARDTVTRLEGIVTAKSEYLSGCVRFSLQPRELKDGKPVEPSWFDIEQVEVVEKGVCRVLDRTGGPMPDPVR